MVLGVRKRWSSVTWNIRVNMNLLIHGVLKLCSTNHPPFSFLPSYHNIWMKLLSKKIDPKQMKKKMLPGSSNNTFVTRQAMVRCIPICVCPCHARQSWSYFSGKQMRWTEHFVNRLKQPVFINQTTITFNCFNILYQCFTEFRDRRPSSLPLPSHSPFSKSITESSHLNGTETDPKKMCQRKMKCSLSGHIFLQQVELLPSFKGGTKRCTQLPKLRIIPSNRMTSEC